MNRWTVIVSGGMLEEEFARSVLENPEIEFIIGVDRGLEFLYRHEICPNYIVGDFDSVSGEILGYYEKETKVPIRKFNPVKDASDTEIALRLCLDLGRKNILILGATGNRIDHIWANVQCLKIGLDAGARRVDSGQSQSDPAFEPGNHTFKERCIRTVLFGVSTGRECGEI